MIIIFLSYFIFISNLWFFACLNHFLKSSFLISCPKIIKNIIGKCKSCQMSFIIIVFQSWVSFSKFFNSCFINLLWVRISFKAQSERCLPIVCVCWNQVKPHSFFGKRFLKIRNGFQKDLFFISHWLNGLG